MGVNRTPENDDRDIKGGGNPFVDYDFYLHPEKGADPKPRGGKAAGEERAEPARRPSQRPVPQGGKRGGARTAAGNRQAGGSGSSGGKKPDRPWYIRARDAVVRFYSTRRPLKVTLTVILALILIAAIVVVSSVYGFLGKIYTGGDDDESRNAVFENESNFATLNDPTSTSLRALLKEWATEGEAIHSDNVINILLMGMDGSDSNVNAAAHSDSMILASINKKTQTITLASIYRDCLTYANINGQDRYLKLTEVSIFDQLSGTVRTIENDFKIQIDDYVAVNFNTFPKVIDAVGGVTIDITQEEYRWLLNHENVNVGGSGSRTLNGAQALAYSRIRYLDSDGDISRTERQRKVIQSIMEAGKSASLSQITGMLDVLLPNVATSMSRTGIISLATQALSGKWYNYQVTSIAFPGEAARYSANSVSTSVASGVWCWIVDYPLAARELQLALYDYTNVPELSEDRVTAIDLFRGASSGVSSSGSSGKSSTTAGNTTRSGQSSEDERKTTDPEEGASVEEESSTRESTTVPETAPSAPEASGDPSPSPEQA